VFPADDKMLPVLRDATGGARIVTFGAAADADVRLIASAPDADGSDIALALFGEARRLRLPAPGRHMAMNALAALAGVVALGADPDAATAALAGFAPMAGRGARRRLALTGGTALLLDESYNANPASVRAALNVLRLQPAARRIAVLGDMLDLGDAGPALHAGLASDVLEAADLVFACGKLMGGLFGALPASRRGGCAADAATLAPLVAAALRPGDAVLVKGSLGIRMRQIVGALDALVPTAGAA
jgi:UDP-N-acetylmuramoyl-tripeptide--D-alanyl-D-alanine ligase